MSFYELSRHKSIGWDFDGTLYDHPNSEAMHHFIKDTPHIAHYIVTFRSHGWQHRCFSELRAMYGDAAPEPFRFERVLNIEDATYENYHVAIRGNQLDPLIQKDIAAYMEWKGMICAKHGITVLVDDLTTMVEQGCTKHSIAYFHPDQLA